MEKKQKIMLYSGILVFILIVVVFVSVYPFSTVDTRDEYISSVTYDKGWETLASGPLSNTNTDDGNHYSMMGSYGIDANLLFSPSLGGRDIYISMRASGSDRIAPAPITLEINGGIITTANVIDFDNVIYNSVDSIELIMGDESGNEYIALYYFRIVEIETAPPPTPEAPILSLIDPDPSIDGIITLYWSVSVLATSYQVFVSGVLIGTTAENTYTDEITLNGVYEYMIRAENEYGVSEFSNIEAVTVAIELVPEAPILSLIDPSVSLDGIITLHWSVSTLATSYQVFVSGVLIDSTIMTTYTDEITLNGVYEYKIRAENEHGVSGFSNVQSVMVDIQEGEPELVPDAPVLNELTYSVDGEEVEVQLIWSTIDCDSYNVYKSVDGDTFILIESDLVLTTYSDVVIDVALYSYKITAENEHGESELSNPTSINITGKGVVSDYTMIYILLGILGGLVGITIITIIIKKKKR